MQTEAKLAVPNSAGMPSWVLRLVRNRILQSVARGLAVSVSVLVVTFILVHLIPGDPVELLLGDLATDAQVATYREILGLDLPLHEQFFAYLGKIVQGDLGTSLVTRQPVTAIVRRTLPVTAWLIAVTVVMALAFAIPLAVVAAVYRHTWFNQVFRLVSSVLLAMPAFYLGLIFILFFALRLAVAPVAGYSPSFPDNLRYLWLPALTVCGPLVPILARVLQSSVADTLEQEFVETAIVRGLPGGVLVWSYLLRPSLAPTLSLLGYIVGNLLSAAVVVEIVFNLPGVGTALIVEGILARDYPVVQGITLVFGLIVVGVSLVSELVSGWLDPRTRAI